MLYIGADAVADNLREAARRARAKPARGGTPNGLFGRMALADAPGELGGLADRLTVLLPWGSLLAAVVLPEDDGLRRLRQICAPGAELRIVVGIDPIADAATRLPPLDDAALRALPARYAAAGFEVTAERISPETVAALGTTWAAKLARGRAARVFAAIAGHAR